VLSETTDKKHKGRLVLAPYAMGKNDISASGTLANIATTPNRNTRHQIYLQERIEFLFSSNCGSRPVTGVHFRIVGEYEQPCFY